MPRRRANCGGSCGPGNGKCESCCCKAIGFAYCIDQTPCSDDTYGDPTCKFITVNVSWNDVPQCVTDHAGGGPVAYRIYDGDTPLSRITGSDGFDPEEPWLEITASAAMVCSDDDGEVPREKWAQFPSFCANCSPEMLQLVVMDSEGEIITRCFACEDSECDERCAECELDVECWRYAIRGGKCGFGFLDDPGPVIERYADALLLFYGERTLEYDPPSPGAEHTCVDRNALIGLSPGEPFTQEHASPVRIDLTGGSPCVADACAVTNDHGETNDDADHDLESLSGSIGGCLFNPNLSDPGIFPIAGEFTDATPDPDVLFTVETGDTEDSRSAWTLETNDPPTHREWSWNDGGIHTNDDELSLARHFCVDSEDEDVNWTTNVTNFYSVEFSDEITTAELEAAVSATLAHPDTYDEEDPNWSHQENASCQACWFISTTELTATYASVFVRITNNTGGPVIASWDIATWPPDPEEEDPCVADLNEPPDLVHDSIALADGAHVDIEVYPTMTSNKVMQVINIGCEVDES